MANWYGYNWIKSCIHYIFKQALCIFIKITFNLFYYAKIETGWTSIYCSEYYL